MEAVVEVDSRKSKVVRVTVGQFTEGQSFKIPTTWMDLEDTMLSEVSQNTDGSY